MREKLLTFLTRNSKPRVVQTTLVLVKVLSGLYHSYHLTQLAVNEKCLCKYYISMIGFVVLEALTYKDTTEQIHILFEGIVMSLKHFSRIFFLKIPQ